MRCLQSREHEKSEVKRGKARSRWRRGDLLRAREPYEGFFFEAGFLARLGAFFFTGALAFGFAF